MKLVDASTIRAVDSSAVRKYGISGLVLMENAGRGVAEALRWELDGISGRAKRVVIVAGKGNNGGDGYVAARHLRNSGVDTVVLALSRLDEMKGDALINARAWVKMGGEVHAVTSSRALEKYSSLLKHSSVIVDAILGTGLTAQVKGLYRKAIDLINTLGRRVVSIDIPSGLDSTTGAVWGAAVRADLTVTMAASKLGLYLYPGREYAGRIIVADIGCPRELVESDRIRWNLITRERLERSLRPRKINSHKGSYGHLLVIAGSPGMTGAAYMAGMGALRAGAGLVTIGVPESLQGALEKKAVETMSIGLPETSGRSLGAVSFPAIKEALRGKTAVVIGPGFRPSDEIRALVGMVVREAKVPILIDGGGLSSLAGNARVLKRSNGPVVITPHPGEAARLLGVTPQEVQADRVASAERLLKATGSTVVLKGASTIVAAPDGVFVNPTGNPALSTAGTGDILAGIIGGMLAQGYTPLDAAVSGVYIHGLAADTLSEKERDRGMIATDLLPVIPGVLNSLSVPQGA